MCPCYYPLTAYYSEEINPKTGKRLITFDRHEVVRSNPEQLMLPCGKCIGCRLEYSRQWALRAVSEANLYDDNCFVTLTYDDDHIPPDGNLRKKDLQLFIKRLRKNIISFIVILVINLLFWLNINILSVIRLSI